MVSRTLSDQALIYAEVAVEAKAKVCPRNYVIAFARGQGHASRTIHLCMCNNEMRPGGLNALRPGTAINREPVVRVLTDRQPADRQHFHNNLYFTNKWSNRIKHDFNNG